MCTRTRARQDRCAEATQRRRRGRSEPRAAAGVRRRVSRSGGRLPDRQRPDRRVGPARRRKDCAGPARPGGTGPGRAARAQTNAGRTRLDPARACTGPGQRPAGRAGASLRLSLGRTAGAESRSSESLCLGATLPGRQIATHPGHTRSRRPARAGGSGLQGCGARRARCMRTRRRPSPRRVQPDRGWSRRRAWRQGAARRSLTRCEAPPPLCPRPDTQAASPCCIAAARSRKPRRAAWPPPPVRRAGERPGGPLSGGGPGRAAEPGGRAALSSARRPPRPRPRGACARGLSQRRLALRASPAHLQRAPDPPRRRSTPGTPAQAEPAGRQERQQSRAPCMHVKAARTDPVSARRATVRAAGNIKVAASAGVADSRPAKRRRGPASLGREGRTG